MGKRNSFGKICKALNNAQQITNVVKQPVYVTPKKYPITECFNILKNMWAEPDYKQLVITPKAWYKLVAFINLVGDYEISGFGRIQSVPNEKGEVTSFVTDFDIIEQEVKAAYVESDEDAVLNFIVQLPAEQRAEWTLDWHSHVEMATSPSGTDWNNYSDMLKARMGKQFPSMIVNKRGEITAQQIISENKHPRIEMLIQQKALSDDEILAIYNECKEKVETLCTKAIERTTYSYGKTGTTTCGFNTRNDYESNDYSKRWWEEYGDYYDNQQWKSSKKSETEPTKEESLEVVEDLEELETCQYCGAPASPWHTQQVGVGICRDCFDEYVTP